MLNSSVEQTLFLKQSTKKDAFIHAPSSSLNSSTLVASSRTPAAPASCSRTRRLPPRTRCSLPGSSCASCTSFGPTLGSLSSASASSAPPLPRGPASCFRHRRRTLGCLWWQRPAAGRRDGWQRRMSTVTS